ncbi:dephospho-CoA kinase [Fluviicola chungangensis]|uniref:Dephospho-CoA kinase n=1 Tax=Fluviicola chungangensis TaxID=2597671 RepID=A0A556N0Q2_9FLAO|nr:dephospho-CoA kinase [Fluviicola chungangensis]TSJ45746.1 dephospho-CoA kinase [Fluviicola chungangensis]
MAKKIGITGGIGSGKSMVSRILQLMGYPVYSSDQRAKEIMNENQALIRSLKELFGEEAYLDSKLNRPYIAAQIFRDDSKRTAMNQLVHPAVREDFQHWASRQKSPILFQESALLFETGNYKSFDAVILVSAPEEIRMKRVKERDRLTDEQIRSRLDAQMPEAEKMKLTDLVIYNDGNQLLVPQILELLKKFK